jgi:hypothetical protein
LCHCSTTGPEGWPEREPLPPPPLIPRARSTCRCPGNIGYGFESNRDRKADGAGVEKQGWVCASLQERAPPLSELHIAQPRQRPAASSKHPGEQAGKPAACASPCRVQTHASDGAAASARLVFWIVPELVVCVNEGPLHIL